MLAFLQMESMPVFRYNPVIVAPLVKLAIFSILFATSLFPQSGQPPSAPAPPAMDSSSPKGAASGDSTRLVFTHFVQPVYPLEAMEQKLQGKVVVHLVISTTGDVLSTEPVSGSPVLVQAAVAAMKKWKFKPYIHNGQPVQIGYKMPYDFAIGDRVVENPVAEANVTATNSVAPPPSPGGSTDAQKVQISGTVSQGLLLHQVVPVYPDQARARFIQGVVVLQAVIGKDGRIKSLQPVSGPTELRDSAVGAVQQWRYRPYILDGQPVEVQTTINVNFKLTN